jgi:hypothetical protein
MTLPDLKFLTERSQSQLQLFFAANYPNLPNWSRLDGAIDPNG